MKIAENDSIKRRVTYYAFVVGRFIGLWTLAMLASFMIMTGGLVVFIITTTAAVVIEIITIVAVIQVCRTPLDSYGQFSPKMYKRDEIEQTFMLGTGLAVLVGVAAFMIPILAFIFWLFSQDPKGDWI